SRRPDLEVLEDRRVPASISGHVFVDPTGNGAAVGDPGQAGVRVKLFVDSNRNGALDSADWQVTSVLSGVDGSFAFLRLPAGRYFVAESVPTNQIRTGPTTSSYHGVNLASNQALTGC